MRFDFKVAMCLPCSQCEEWDYCDCACNEVDEWISCHPTYERDKFFYVEGSAPTYSCAVNICADFLRGMRLVGRSYDGFTVRIRPHE